VAVGAISRPTGPSPGVGTAPIGPVPGRSSQPVQPGVHWYKLGSVYPPSSAGAVIPARKHLPLPPEIGGGGGVPQ